MPGILRVDQANVDIINAKTIGGKVYIPGHNIQIVQTVITGTFSTSGTTFVDITGASATITPTSTTSKILVDIVLSCGESSDSFPAFYVRRNGTTILLANALSPGTQTTFGYTNTGNDARDQYLLTAVPFKYLDSPASTSALTYQIQVRPMGSASRTFFLNRPATVGDSNQLVSTSTITLTEIAQ